GGQAALPRAGGAVHAARRHDRAAPAGRRRRSRTDGGLLARRCRAGMRHNRSVTSDEIRELFLGFFEERDHLRLPSGSLVPASFDPSVLLTKAGMPPPKPHLLG